MSWRPADAVRDEEALMPSPADVALMAAGMDAAFAAAAVDGGCSGTPPGAPAADARRGHPGCADGNGCAAAAAPSGAAAWDGVRDGTACPSAGECRNGAVILDPADGSALASGACLRHQHPLKCVLERRPWDIWQTIICTWRPSCIALTSFILACSVSLLEVPIADWATARC